MDYKAATKELRKRGTANATGEALAAMASDLLAVRFCMNAPFIYGWGQKHDVDLWLLARKLRMPLDNNGWAFIGAVMEDRPFSLNQNGD